MIVRTGCIPDAPDGRDYRFEYSVLLSAPAHVTTAEIDNRKYLPPVDNQIAQNCVNHAFEGQQIGTATAAGIPIGRLSKLFNYFNARKLENADPRIPVVDRGSSYRLLYRSAAPRTSPTSRGGYGVVSETDWPEIPENIDRVPDEDVYRKAETRLVRRYERIPDGNPSPDAIRMAARRLHFPTCCMIWDEKAVNIGGAVYDGPGGQSYGGHALLVVGYSAKLRAFMLRNSHGKDFGFDDGHMWISEDFVAHSTFDKWVTLSPIVMEQFG